MTEFCTNCGALCCGKLKIEARKECYYPFCASCFWKFELLKMKEIRRILRTNKNFVTTK